jgi:energy-coupling factor transporter ATP-binding protein EcfA2
MSKTNLQKITLTSIRGATKCAEILFNPDKNITMFGENGTGKSTIVDGFSLLCERDFGSLEERSGASKDHIVSINGKAAGLSVKLDTSKGAWKGALAKKTIAVDPTAPPPPDVRILRRSNILRLIDQQPKKRFEELARFVDTAGVERSETTLRGAIKTTEGELQDASSSYLQAVQTLEQHWETRGQPGTDAQEWARGERERDITALQSEVETLDNAKSALTAAGQAKTTLEARIQRFNMAAEALAAAELALQQAQSALTDGNESLVTLLQQAKSYIEAEPTIGSCPVCEQDIQRDPLLQRLQARLEAMHDLVAASERVATARQVRDAQASQVETARTEFAERIDEATQRLLLPELDGLVGTAILRAELEAIQQIEAEKAGAKIDSWNALTPKIQTLGESLEAHLEAQRETVHLHTTVTQLIDTIEEKDRQQHERQDLLDRLSGLLEVVESNRKAVVSEVLDDICKEVESLYSTIHPGEDIGKVRLYLDPKTRGSLHLEANFFGIEQIPPQSLYSDSHLDTLGLCVFLALAKKYRTDDTIVVLDDVVTSVDSGHLDRYINLVEQESEHFDHVIVTTHYRPWRERYRNHRAPSGNVHFIELGPWSLTEGIRVYGTKLALDELRQSVAAAPMDRQAVASKAGILLESILEFLARCYGCRLPLRNHPGHTLRELADGISSKLLNVLAVEHQDAGAAPAADGTVPTTRTDLKPLIDKIKGLAAVRNQVGCHFNYAADDATDAEILELGNAAVELGELLICPDGGDLPTRSKSGSYWETKSGKVRLHPLAEP